MSSFPKLEPSDVQKLVDFMKFMQKYSEMTEGYNTSVPIEGYILMGCLVILIFDYLITFDQEVNYVWSSSWSFGLPLFYINRYVPFVNLALFIDLQLHHKTQESCNVQIQVATWIIMIPSFFGQLIIVLRTCALWQNNTIIVVSLTLLTLCSLISTSIFTAKNLRNMELAPTPSFMKGCIMFDPSDLSLYIYVALFISEFVIISLTLVKAFQHLRRNHTAWVSQLYQNGIFYCLVILLLSLFNIIIPTTSLPYAYKQSLRMPQAVFHSMFCNRVMMQLLKHRQEFLRRGARSGNRRNTLTGDNGGDSGTFDPNTTATNDILTSVLVDGTNTSDTYLTTVDDHNTTFKSRISSSPGSGGELVGVQEVDIELDVLERSRQRGMSFDQEHTNTGRRGRYGEEEPSWVILPNN